MIRDHYFEEIIPVMVPRMFVYHLQLVQWNGVVVELTISNVGTIAVSRRRRTGLLKLKMIIIAHTYLAL